MTTPSWSPAAPERPGVLKAPPRMDTGPVWCIPLLNWKPCWPSSVLTDQPDRTRATPRMSASV